MFSYFIFKLNYFLFFISLIFKWLHLCRVIGWQIHLECMGGSARWAAESSTKESLQLRQAMAAEPRRQVATDISGKQVAADLFGEQQPRFYVDGGLSAFL